MDATAAVRCKAENARISAVSRSGCNDSNGWAVSIVSIAASAPEPPVENEALDLTVVQMGCVQRNQFNMKKL
jgi:hypothetical protein